MYTLFALGLGLVITAMNGLNSLLARGIGSIAAVVAIHLSGLVAVSLVLLVRKEARAPGRAPLYLYAGGAVGLLTVFSSAYAFSRLGASLAVALALTGQVAGSLVIDSTGLLGMPKYPFAARRLIGLGIALAGLLLMVGEWKLSWSSLAMAFLAGLCPSISTLLNSRLGSRIGLWRGVRANYLVGLAAAAPITLALGPPLAPLAEALAATSPLVIAGGGIMGVGVVASISFLLPRMPTLRSTLAIFSGQVLAGLAADALWGGTVPARRIGGAALLIAGLAANSLLDRRKP
jgi:transporter family-2 protein